MYQSSGLFSQPIPEAASTTSSPILTDIQNLQIARDSASKFELDIFNAIHNEIITYLTNYFAHHAMSSDLQQLIINNFDGTEPEASCFERSCLMYKAKFKCTPTIDGMLTKLTEFQQQLADLLTSCFGVSRPARDLLTGLKALQSLLREKAGELLDTYDSFSTKISELTRKLTLLNKGRMHGEDEGRRQQQRGAISAFETAGAGIQIMEDSMQIQNSPPSYPNAPEAQIFQKNRFAPALPPKRGSQGITVEEPPHGYQNILGS